MIRYLLVMVATPTVLGPQILFLAMAFLFGGQLHSDIARFLALVAAVLAVCVVTASSVVTWARRKDRVIARYILGLAAASTALSVIGIGIGLTLIIGLLTVFEIFFLLSLPVLVFAVWNTRTSITQA